jgi:hypothetical protein
MSLYSEIQTIVNTLYPDSSFILSSKFQANVTAYLSEDAVLPLVILDNELSKNVSIQKNNNILKDSKILISFLDLDSTDNTDEQSETIREAMEVMADRVANNIYQLQSVHPIGNQKYKITPLFHVFSSNMTGVALEMQVNYNEIVIMCKIP